MVNGKYLISLGLIPSKYFGQIISYSNENGLSDTEILNYAKSIIPKEILPREFPIPYNINIAAESSDEEDNILEVIKTMDALMRTPTIVGGAIMPDSCPTGNIGQIPVGGVAVTKNAIHPSFHSADICCSVMATNLGRVNPSTVMDFAMDITHFGFGGREDRYDLDESILNRILNNKFLNSEKSVELSKSHLGTQGDGNHFLFVGTLESTGDVCIVTHHGSRGFGANLFKEGMRVAERYRAEISPSTIRTNAWIPYNTDDGKEYWGALQIIRDWTKLNHSVLHDSISDKFNGSKGRFWNEHNFVFKDGDLFYHAKGATPLDDRFVPDSVNGLRLIPLNMSEPILVVKGDSSSTNLGFAPHGTGRNISRTAHIKRNSSRTFEEIFKEETKGLDVRFFSGKIDISELPSAYKDANSVQRQMEKFGLGSVVDRILPYGCIMAGDWKRGFKWSKKKKNKM